MPLTRPDVDLHVLLLQGVQVMSLSVSWGQLSIKQDFRGFPDV